VFEASNQANDPNTLKHSGHYGALVNPVWEIKTNLNHYFYYTSVALL
jgi:hypothetical protein